MADQKHQGGGRPGRLSGERCKECGAAGLRVRDSKRRPDNMRRLRVECIECGHRYSLLEVDSDQETRRFIPLSPLLGGAAVMWEGDACAGVYSPTVFIDGWEVRVPYVIRWMAPPDAPCPNWYAQHWSGEIKDKVYVARGGSVDITVVHLINSKLRELRDLDAKPDRPYQPFRPSRRANTSASE